jgi:glutamate racemase
MSEKDTETGGQSRSKREYCPIGVFDSGFGGVQVLRYLVQHMPEYDYIYLGDTARAPYGDKAPEEIRAYTVEGVEYLFSRGCKLVVLACNTASVHSMEDIQKMLALPEVYDDRMVVSVLPVVAQKAATIAGSDTVAVLATSSTVMSREYTVNITKYNPECSIIEIACPALVPLIESGQYPSQQMSSSIDEYCNQLPEGTAVLILGCTHYGIIQDEIRSRVCGTINIISAEQAMPEYVKSYIEKNEKMQSRLSRGNSALFFTTGDATHFDTVGSQIFGSEIRSENIVLRDTFTQ